MKQFEVGKTYSMKSVCDHNCVWTYKVISRTAKTITVTDGQEVKTLRIVGKLSEYRGCETVRPLGNYSFAPLLSPQ